MAAASSVNAVATNHAADSHRREYSRPVGNSRSMNANPVIGITETQFTNHAAARAPGSEPGAATSPLRHERAVGYPRTCPGPGRGEIVA